jgi:CheY-like chemotaxis protein
MVTMTDTASVGDGDVPKRVLVVEDDATNMMYLCKVLVKAGYDPVPARSAQEALGILAQQTIDVVLSDIMMPDADGIELVGQIRQIPAFVNLPIIMCTAAKEREYVIAAAKHNIQGYVLKHVDRSLIVSRLNTLFQSLATSSTPSSVA